MNDISAKIREEFPNKKIVIVGDLVADQFLRGTISRVSREAPVFILSHDNTETLAGGAGNAAVNVAGLGGKAILVGIIGKDLNGENLKRVLTDSNVNCKNIIESADFQTTTKVRVLAGQSYAPRQQVIRIDYENKKELDPEIIDLLKQNIISTTKDADAIIISDYNCGAATPAIGQLCAGISRKKKIPLLIDSRFRLNEFSGATTATPNQEEVEQILGKNFTEEDCLKLREKLNLKALLITRGNQGMLLLEKDKARMEIEAVGAKEPVDVTGAGDTVMATYTLGLASGLGFPESAKLANYAGGIVVMKKGTAAVSSGELLETVRRSTEY